MEYLQENTLINFSVQAHPKDFDELIEEFDDIDPEYRTLVVEIFSRTGAMVDATVAIEEADVDRFSEWCDDKSIPHKMV